MELWTIDEYFQVRLIFTERMKLCIPLFTNGNFWFGQWGQWCHLNMITNKEEKEILSYTDWLERHDQLKWLEGIGLGDIYIVKSAFIVNHIFTPHILILTDDGRLYYIIVFRVPESGLYIFLTRRINVKEKIICIACGVSSYAIVTDKGEVYRSCEGPYENLFPYYFKELRKVELLPRTTVKIVHGAYHILALTDEGEVYSWGVNFHGQLNNDANNTQYTDIPFKIKLPNVSKASDIAAMKLMSAIKSRDDGLAYIEGNLLGAKISRFASCEYTNIFDVCNSWPDRVYIDEDFIILNDLERAFNDCLTSDLTIEVDGQYIHVHKSFLKIRSLYFKTMFQFNGLENTQRFIKYDDHSYVVYKAYLKYLYTGMIDLSSLEDELDLLILSDKYCEKNLQSDCTEIIKKKITESNLFSIKEIAIKYNIKKLEEYCNNFYLRDTSYLMRFRYASQEDV